MAQARADGQSLIVSGLVHMLILMLLTLWQVSTNLDGLLGSPGGSKVTLVSSAVGGGIESQILAQVSPVAESRPVELMPMESPEFSMTPIVFAPADGCPRPSPCRTHSPSNLWRSVHGRHAATVDTDAQQRIAAGDGVCALRSHHARVACAGRERVEESGVPSEVKW